MLEVNVSRKDSVTIASVSGEMAGEGAEKFTEVMHDFVSGGAALVAVDLTGLTGIDSTGLGSLIALVTRARLTSGRVVLAGAPPLVVGVFNVTRLDQWFEMCDTVDQAVEQLTNL